MMSNQRGFSLLELSIVLVIIGLITGGIMAGRSMVRAAELRSVASDLSKYRAAVNTFREKYNGYPGDLNNAVRYWGAQGGGTADGYDATCAALTAAATGTATCNGNGDGMEGSTAATFYERFRFWQHLANAGLVEGQFSGVTGTGGTAVSLIGVNSPASKISGVGYTVEWRGVVSAHAALFDGSYDNWIRVGTESALSATSSAFLKAEEAFSLDQKMDDGSPAYGRLTMTKNGGTLLPNCTTTNVAATAAYDLTRSSLECSLQFGNLF